MKKIKTALISAAFFSFLLSASAVFAQWVPANYSGYGLPSGSIYLIILGIMKWFLAIFGFIAIIGFIISGILYLTSAGDDTQQEKAKNQMMWSIIGVVVGLAGFVMLQAINSMLSTTTLF